MPIAITKLLPTVVHSSPISYMRDGLITSHIFDGKNDPMWQEVMSESRAEFKGLHSLYHEWRLYLAVMLIYNNFINKEKKYYFVECGVGMGMTNYVLQSYLSKKVSNKKLDTFFYFGIDSFSGIDKTKLTVEEFLSVPEYRTKSYGNQDKMALEKRFSKFINHNLIEGIIPEILNSQIPAPDFLHIDMNNSYPEVKALEFFLPQMAEGSIILLDDYAFHSAEIQRLKINEFLKNNTKYVPIGLPTGQGLIII